MQSRRALDPRSPTGVQQNIGISPCGCRMKISVVMPCYNSAKTIGTQLEAIAGQAWIDSWEVVVSDNGSTDESLNVIERYRSMLPALRIVHARDRRGASYARNVGIQAATGEALVFCDSDDQVAPGWLTAMGEALLQFDFVACRIDTEKLNPDWARIHDPLQKDGLLKLRFYPYLSFAGGCTLGVKRTVFDAVGGCDEAFKYVDDASLCCRIQQSGVTLHFVPNAVLHYRHRTTYGGIYRQARNWAQETVLLFKQYRLPGTSDVWRWRPYAGSWWNILKQIPSARRSAKDRAQLASLVGWHIGLLAGSIMNWIPPPVGE
jgi:glycosyltransferase involved in cell wall biosynthesis